jgi:hypothetical protein
LWDWRKTVIGFTSLCLIPPIPALEKLAEKGLEILWVRVPSGKRERFQDARVDKLPSGGKCPLAMLASGLGVIKSWTVTSQSSLIPIYSKGKKLLSIAFAERYLKQELSGIAENRTC